MEQPPPKFVLSACIAILLVGVLAYPPFSLASIGLVDFYGLAAFAQGFAVNGAWPATPYFPAGYPLLLAPFGLWGNVLLGGYLLSLTGLIVAIYALTKLGSEFRIKPTHLLLCTIFLVSLDPLVRASFVNPSVDGLYTGLGLLFFAAFIHLWQRRDSAAEPWALRALVPCAFVLPLLRYHALVVVVPLLLILLLGRPLWRRSAALAAFVCLIALATNNGLYRLSYGKPLQSAGLLQIRCGLEFDLRKYYATPELLFADYENFAARGRERSLLSDYGPGEIASHLRQTFISYLKRPAILLSLLLCAGLLILGRQPDRLLLLSTLWLLLYCLALSSAYYTDRAAALPAAVALFVCAALLPAAFAASRRSIAFAVMLLLVSAGYLLSSEQLRMQHSRLESALDNSRELNREITSAGLQRSQVAVTDWLLQPISNNPWCEPYVVLEQSWLDDPLIQPEQRPGLLRTDAAKLLSGQQRIRKVGVILDDNGELPAESEVLVKRLSGSFPNADYRPGGLLLLDVPAP